MEQLDKILTSSPRGVLSLTGGGGKTSLMFHLTRLLALSGKKVLTTTTTKIFYPTLDQAETVLVNSDPAIILRQSAKHRTVTAGHSTRSGKLIGFAPEVIDTFAAAGLFDWIIVEADGASRRPLKAPASHEPVIPAATTVLVAVAGLEVLGQPFSEELVFRAEIAGPLMGLVTGETITEAAMARLFAHPEGLFKDAPPRASRYIFLNKADDSSRREGAARIADQLRSLTQPIAEALIVGQALDRLQVHSVHNLAAKS